MLYLGHQGFRHSLLIALAAMLLAGCDNLSDPESSEDLVNSAEIELSGSVGDGPVVGATIRIFDKRGNEIASTTGSAGATYELVVPPKSEFPVTVEATGGTDLVSGEPLDFTLRTIWVDPKKNWVNLSPIGTLASEIAQCDGGRIRSATLKSALKTLHEHLGTAIDPDRVPDTLFSEIAPEDMPEVLLGNEALGEVLRRTHAALEGTSSALSFDELIDKLACDLADSGGVNASAATDTRIMGAFQAAAASVLVETIAGQLQVGGSEAMSRLDDAIATVSPDTATSVHDVPVHPSLPEKARAGLAALSTVFPDPEILQFMLILDDGDGDVRAAVSGALDADAQTTFEGLPERAALADESELSLLQEAVDDVQTAQPPNLSFAANPTSVTSGNTSMLSWAATGATSCLASGSWSGERGVEGTFTTPALSAPATYALDCVGLGGSASGTATVSVAAPAAAPTVTLSASPTQIDSGSSAALTWSSTNATSCSASGSWSGSRAVSGNQSVGPLSASATYSLTCSGSGGSATATATVTVNAAPPPAAPTVTLSANPMAPAYNGSTTVTWSSTNASSCSASGAWSGAKATSGSQSFGSLTADKTYTLTCTGAGGSATQSVTVDVGNPPAPTVMISANPMAPAYNGSTTVSWSSTNASSCSASGGWSGTKATSGTQSFSSLTTDQTYSLTCSGAGGSATQSVTVDVGNAPPTVTISANPMAPAYNGSTTVTWSSTNATSCTASGGWTGTKATSGSQSFSNLTADQTYSLSCTGAGGSASQSVTVDVGAVPPTVTLSANPMAPAYNGSTTVTWSSTNATSCTASGAWSGTKATSGSQSFSSLTADQTYTLACTGSGGSASQSVTVDVGNPPAPTLSLSASPTSVAYNGSTTLSWSSTNATSCTASGGWTGTKATSGSETRSSLTTNTTFTLACTGAGGSVTQSASVTVASGPPTVTLGASPSWVNPNSSSTLSWSSTNATSCTASGGWSGTKATSGSESTGNLTQDKSYTLTCTGTGGNAMSMTSVSVRSAQLSWEAPTQNVDGSALTNLAGFKIYYGTSPRTYSQVQTINSPTQTSATVTLSPGTWYFAMTALNTLGEESAKTNEVSKTVN